MREDEEVRTLCLTSAVLRPLIKASAAEFEEHFDAMDTDDEAGVSLGEFLGFCEREQRGQRAKGRAAAGGGGRVVPAQGHTYSEDPVAVQRVRVVQSWEEQRAEIQAEDRRRREQSDILGKVFALVDTDGSGLIDQEEMSQALQSNPQVREFAASTNSLRPMLEQAFFMKAFRLMDTDDEDGVSLEEFVEYCLIVGEVAELNGYPTGDLDLSCAA